jgi:hypothetical protein
MIEREGRLSRFEAKMFKWAKMLLELPDGDTNTAMYILCELATETGFKGRDERSG